MKKACNIYDNITVSDFRDAAFRSFEDHEGEREVIDFRRNLDENCYILYNAFRNDSYKSLLKYRKMEKTNNNGKKRCIDSPNLTTRIYQYVYLNKIEPVYFSKDNLMGLNCKKGCGITSSIDYKSVLHRAKEIYFDRLDLNYVLVIDQRKCYDHITVPVFRKSMKRLTDDHAFIDYAVSVCFVDGRLPIGTPTSPMVHHIVMLDFDIWAKEICNVAIRYADNNLFAFATSEEAQQAKWRVKNYWWYKLGIRAKSNECQVVSMDQPLDFCGYVLHRNRKPKCSHNKRYVTVRRSTVDRARKCRSDESWSSYFGLMKHADAYRLMSKIEQSMKLRELTQTIRIDRTMDARNIEIRELVNTPITIYDYEIRYNTQKQPNWIKCLVGIDEVVDGERTGKILAREFHGNYQGIIQFICACEKLYGKSQLLPIEDVEIENQCGYIFKGSTNQLTYIEDEVHR